jgi:bacteriocin-like protein
MSNEIKKMNELSDEQLMEIVGGYDNAASALSSVTIVQPYYGIVVKPNPGTIVAKYGVQPLYGIKPPVVQPYYGIVTKPQK